MNKIDTEIRAFIGIPLDDAIRQLLSDSLGPLKAEPNNYNFYLHKSVPKIRWVKPENWHITLAFFGRLSEDEANDIKILLASSLAAIKPFKVKLETVSRFPGSNGRTIAAEFGNNVAFHELYGQIQDMCKIVGLRQEHRPFKPHVTLGRIKIRNHYENRGHHKRKPSTNFRIPCIMLGREVTLDRVQLFKSHLSSKGSRYEILAETLFTG